MSNGKMNFYIILNFLFDTRVKYMRAKISQKIFQHLWFSLRIIIFKDKKSIEWISRKTI